MLETIKLSLRINNNMYDKEIQGLIDSCKKELELAGIAYSNIKDDDPLIIQIITYDNLKALIRLNYNEEKRKE